MSGIKIRGTGSCVPAKIMTNDDFSRIVDTSDQWIVSRTGIRERHHCVEESHLDLCLGAAKATLDMAGVAPEEVGLCIVCTVAADQISPAGACLLQRDLGLAEDTICFDLNAACSGFLFGLHTAECMLAASPKRFGLVIGGEVLSRLTDFTDRGTCVLFGDAAGAVVVEYDPQWPSISAVLGVRGNDKVLGVTGATAGARIHMEGQPVFKFAVETVPKCIQAVLDKTGATMDQIDQVVFHQANERIVDLAVKRFGVPIEKVYKNLSRYGNTSAASVPLVLDELARCGKLGPGKKALCVGFGGGLTWGGALVEFA